MRHHAIEGGRRSLQGLSARPFSGPDQCESRTVDVDVPGEGTKVELAPEPVQPLGKSWHRSTARREHREPDPRAPHVPVVDLREDAAVRLACERFDTGVPAGRKLLTASHTEAAVEPAGRGERRGPGQGAASTAAVVSGDDDSTRRLLHDRGHVTLKREKRTT